MQVEILGVDNKVHYRRPHDHPDVVEAMNTEGYAVRAENPEDSLKLLAYMIARHPNFERNSPPRHFPPTEARIDPDSPAGA